MPPYPERRRSASGGGAFEAAKLGAAISNQIQRPPSRRTWPDLMKRGLVMNVAPARAATVNESRTDWLTGSVNENCAGWGDEIVTARVPLASSAWSVMAPPDSIIDQVEGYAKARSNVG